MNVDISVSVSVCDLFVVDLREPVVSCDSAGVREDEAAYGICNSGVLFYTPVFNLDVAVYKILVVQESGIHVTDLFALVTIEDVSLSYVLITHSLECSFYAVLDGFDIYSAVLSLLLGI